MKGYEWQTQNEVLELGQIVDVSCERVLFVPETILDKMDFDLKTFYREPEKYTSITLKLKHINKYISDYKNSYYVENGGELLVPLYYILYTLEISIRLEQPLICLVKTVSLDDGTFKYQLSGETEQKKISDWCKQISSFTERKFADCNDREITEPYKHVRVTAQVDRTVYVGPTIDFEISESMTVGEFQQIFIKKFNAIPAFVYEKVLYKDNSVKLFKYGVRGNILIKIPEWCDNIHDVSREMFKQLNISEDKTTLLFYYIKRPWSVIIDGDFDKLEVLPPLWKSIGVALMLKVVYSSQVKRLISH